MAKRGPKPKAAKAEQQAAEESGAEIQQANTSVDQVEFNKHRENILNKLATKDAAVAALRNARKAAEEKGIDTKAFDLTHKLAKLDPLTRKRIMNNVATYANWMDLPLGLYGALNADGAPEGGQGPKKAANAHDAYQHGYEARKAGIPRDRNPYPTGNDAELWTNAWDDADRDIASGKLQPTPAAA
jgi:ribosome modulation factor